MDSTVSLELENKERLPSEGASALRRKRITAAALSGMAGKGISLLVNAAIVPIAVRSLGAVQYGILITITTTITMLFVLDLGIANTLTNLISEAYSRDDRDLATQYFATALWALMAIVLVLGLIGFAAWPFVPWSTLFQIDRGAVPQVSRAFALAYAICLVAVVAALTSRVLAGYQELHSSNVFSSAGSIMSLAAIALTAKLHPGLVSFVAAFAVGPLAANIACFLWICLVHKPWITPWPRHFRVSYFSNIFHSGSLFFLTQLAGLVVLNSDNLIISRYLGPAQVTPYNVTWRLTSYGSSLLTLFIPALWPAYAEAYIRGDRSWIQNAYSKAMRGTVLLLISIAAFLLLFGKSIIKLWAGVSAIPSTPLLALMCVWMVIYGVTVNQSTLMGATGRVGRQAVSAIIGSTANLVLSILWVRWLGLTGVILGTVVSYILFIVLLQSLQVRKILYGPWDRTLPAMQNKSLSEQVAG